jgi:signal transduction histidine kinase
MSISDQCGSPNLPPILGIPELERDAATARDEAERMRRFMAETLNRIDSPFIALDAKWRIGFVNAEAIRFFKIGSSQLAGLPFWAVFESIHQTELAGCLIDAANQQRPVDARIYHPPLHCWLEVHIYPSPDGLSVFIRDVSEQERSDRNFRFLSETSQMLAESLDVQATLDTLVRRVVYYMADWSVVDTIDEEGYSRDVAVAHRDLELEVRLSALRAVRPVTIQTAYGPGYVLRTGEPQLYREIDRETQELHISDPEALAELRAIGFRSGIVVPLTVRQKPVGTLTVMSGTAGRYNENDLALVQVLARRAAMMLENARLYREAMEAVAARDQFLSVAAHELRTPLTAITGFTELLRRELNRPAPDADKRDRFIHRLSDAGERLTGLVNDLLDVARLRLGELPLRQEPTDLVALLSSILSRYRDRSESGKHEISLWVPDDECVVSIDPDRIEQVIANLLDNAIKYSPRGGTIRIELRREDDAAVITVNDPGIGLPANALESIFQPFDRASNATEAYVPGLGLGLFICRNIVERHGGTITAASQGPGQGTTITVRLPFKTITGERVVANTP